jgi:hypothetical protein
MNTHARCILADTPTTYMHIAGGKSEIYTSDMGLNVEKLDGKSSPARAFNEKTSNFFRNVLTNVDYSTKMCLFIDVDDRHKI